MLKLTASTETDGIPRKEVNAIATFTTKICKDEAWDIWYGGVP
jgi:hypothetical protein